MSTLQLAPYNDSMRLGQGYNSFLDIPCIDSAMRIDPRSIDKDKSHDCVPQVVTYSSRFVEKISEVASDLNISAGSSIRNGSLSASANSLVVDEHKFHSSNLNAVISVKVMNRSRVYQPDDAKFIPTPLARCDTAKFQEIYGDCFISGFIEGGELHGLISMKVLDTSKTEEIKSKVKSIFNCGPEWGDFAESESSESASLAESLKETETSISINWSGGGQIKPEATEWSLESLIQAAAAFPANVAKCPLPTWAILTQYKNNRDFLEWAIFNNFQIFDYCRVYGYAYQLLDTYMGYKTNLTTIQYAIADQVRDPSKAVESTVKALSEERKSTRQRMEDIVAEVHTLNDNPAALEEVEAKSKIEPPEFWAAEIPVLSTTASYSANVTSSASAQASVTRPKPTGVSSSASIDVVNGVSQSASATTSVNGHAGAATTSTGISGSSAAGVSTGASQTGSATTSAHGNSGGGGEQVATASTEISESSAAGASTGASQSGIATTSIHGSAGGGGEQVAATASTGVSGSSAAGASTGASQTGGATTSTHGSAGGQVEQVATASTGVSGSATVGATTSIQGSAVGGGEQVATASTGVSGSAGVGVVTGVSETGSATTSVQGSAGGQVEQVATSSTGVGGSANVGVVTGVSQNGSATTSVGGYAAGGGEQVATASTGVSGSAGVGATTGASNSQTATTTSGAGHSAGAVEQVATASAGATGSAAVGVVTGAPQNGSATCVHGYAAGGGEQVATASTGVSGSAAAGVVTGAPQTASATTSVQGSAGAAQTASATTSAQGSASGVVTVSAGVNGSAQSSVTNNVPAITPPPPALCSPEVEAHLNRAEREFVNSIENRVKFSSFRFDSPQGGGGEGLTFNDCVALSERTLPVIWPTQLDVQMVFYGPTEIVGSCKLKYGDVEFAHGSAVGRRTNMIVFNLYPDERINKIRMGKGKPTLGGVEGVGFIEISTNHGVRSNGGREPSGNDLITYTPPPGFSGLKGFYGKAGEIIDRLGIIWGSESS